MSGRQAKAGRRIRCTWCGVETGNPARHMRRRRCAFWRATAAARWASTTPTDRTRPTTEGNPA